MDLRNRVFGRSDGGQTAPDANGLGRLRDALRPTSGPGGGEVAPADPPIHVETHLAFVHLATPLSRLPQHPASVIAQSDARP
jgi:hypothetical protein